MTEERPNERQFLGGNSSWHSKSAASGIEVASELLLRRPAKLGTVRLAVVDGPSGSGKSTFALEWAEALRDGCAAGMAPGPVVTVLSSDVVATWDEPFDWWPRLEFQVLGPLADGRPGRLQMTEWLVDGPRPGRWKAVPVPDVLILEGVSCGRRAARDRVSVLVWVEVPDRAERLERSVRRDGERSRAALTRWQHDEDRFFATDDVAARADVILDPAD